MGGSVFDAIILGIVEGLTEFIPVSSTGHLILTEAWLGNTSLKSGVFDVFIQIGAIFAVLWVYRARVFGMIRGLYQPGPDRALLINVMIAFIPAAVMGVLLHSVIKSVLFTPSVVAVGLIVGGIIMLWVERRAPAAQTMTIDQVTPKTALLIGVCQIAALVPGISRAGASIVGAQFFGVARAAATEFSFFLAIPTILGAALFDLYRARDFLSVADIPYFALGTLTAFIAALIVIRWLITYVSRHGFAPFAYYRLGLGAVMLALISLGWM